MKRITAIIASLAVVLGSCTEDTSILDYGMMQSAVTFNATSCALSRAATTLSFEEDDRFGLFQESNNEKVNLEYSYVSETDPLKAEGSSSFLYETNMEPTFYAYYPYDATVTSSTISIDLSTKSDETGDLLIAESDVDDTAASVELTFRHVLSLFTLTITEGDVAPDFADLKFYLEYSTTAECDLTTGTLTTIGDLVESELTLTDNGDGTYSSQAIVVPNDYATLGARFCVYSSSNNYTIPIYYKTLEQEFVSGYEYKYVATVGDKYTIFEFDSDIAWNSGTLTSSTSGIDIFYNESGAVYEIYTANGLTAFRDLVNGSSNSSSASCYGDESYFDFGTSHITIDGKLMCDIELSGSWTPIGNRNSSTDLYYGGVFDGGNYEVTGISISHSHNTATSNQNYQGLFGYVMGTSSKRAVIKNLGVNANIQGVSYIGGVAGYVTSYSDIINCYNSGGSITGCTSYYINDSYSSSNVGGVVGSLANNSSSIGSDNPTMYNCYNLATVNAVKLSDITRYCYNRGGLVGSAWAAKIVNCYNKGTVSGSDTYYHGGICGQMSEASRLINCYNEGSISGSNAGGITAYVNTNCEIKNCYNVGEISGTSDLGSIIGSVYYNSSSGTFSFDVENCYYDTDSSYPAFGDYSVTVATNNMEEADLELCFTDMTIDQMQSDSFVGTLNLNAQALAADYDSTEAVVSGWLYSSGSYPSFTYKAALSNDNGVYLIYTAKDMALFRDMVNAGNYDLDAKLMNNINLSTICYRVDGTEANDVSWSPITPSLYDCYTGTFDGGGYKISGLYINNTSDSYQGLFGSIGSGAVVQNLGVSGSVSSEQLYVAGVVAICSGADVINCYNECSVSGTSSYVGGVVSSINSSSRVINCYNKGSIKSSGSYIGGVVAYSRSSSIVNCYNISGVTTTSSGTSTSGIVGYIDRNTYVKNCYCAAEVTQSSSGKVGYIVGYIDTDSGEYADSQVVDCYAIQYDSDTATALIGEYDTDSYISTGNEFKSGDDMKDEAFSVLLNSNASELVGSYSEICSWLYNLSDYPSFTYDDTIPTVGGYFEISTVEEMVAFRDMVNGGDYDMNGRLMADIDLQGSESDP